jgi:hypothetical protein
MNRRRLCGPMALGCLLAGLTTRSPLAVAIAAVLVLAAQESVGRLEQWGMQ